MAWTDLDDTKRLVSINGIIEHYGDGEIQDKREYKINCPFHNDAEPSCSINTEKETWYCHGACKKGGDIFTYVALKEEFNGPHTLASRRRACAMIDGWFGIVREPPPRSERQAAAKQESPTEAAAVETPPEPVVEEPAEGAVINPPLQFGPLRSLDVEAGLAYAEKRGIPRDLAEEYGLAVALRGRFKDRLVIPLHDEKDVLVGYAARSLDDENPDKYLFPASTNGFYKSYLVYNLNRVLLTHGPATTQSVIIVEGFFSCMAVVAAGYPCVALMGSSLLPHQARLLRQYFSHVLFLLDGDASGRRCLQEALVVLGARAANDEDAKDVYVRGLILPDGMQPDHYAQADLTTLLRRNR